MESLAILPLPIVLVMLIVDASAAEQAFQITKRGSVVAHDTKLRSLAYSPDGRWLVSASDGRTVKLWRVANGTLRDASKPQVGQTAVAFSNDGKKLFVGRGGGRTTLDAFDLDGLHIWRVDTGHTVENVTVSPDGRLVATAAFLDNSLKLWDATTGRTVKTLTSPTRPRPGAAVGRLRPMGYTAFSPDGKYFAGCVASGDHLAIPTIWDAKTFEVKSRFVAHENRCHAILFSPDNTILATGSVDGALKLWNVATVVNAWSKPEPTAAEREQIAKFIEQLDDDRFQVRERAEKELTDIGAIVTDQLNEVIESTKSAEVRFRATRILKSLVGVSAKPLEKLIPTEVLSEDQTGGVRTLSFSGDGRLLAAGSWQHGTEDGQLTVWNLAEPKEPVLNLQTIGIEALSFSPDGKTLATGMQDGTITLWDVTKESDDRP